MAFEPVLRRVLNNDASMVSLYIPGTIIQRSNLESLAAAFAVNRVVVSVDLQNTGLLDEGVGLLAKGLVKNRAVRVWCSVAIGSPLKELALSRWSWKATQCSKR
jgi:hypothetical protein